MASLGSLIIELGANTARLQSDMGKAVGIVESGARKMKSVFATLGVVGGGGLLGSALTGAVKEAIAFGDSISKASIKSGIGAKAMSELAYAAKLSDVDITALSTSIKKMQVALSQAGSGSKEPVEALTALGLTFAQLRRQKPEDQFELLADRISQLKDPADRARAATELFGKAGADLLPFFAQGAAGIAKARAEAEKLGVSFGEEQIKKLADADEAVKRLDASWKGLKTTLVAEAAPALTKVFDSLSKGPGQAFMDFSQAMVFPNSGAPQTPFEKLGENLHPELGGRGRPPKILGYAKAPSESDKELDKLVDKFGSAAEDITYQMNSALADEVKDSNEAWGETLIAWQDFQDARVEAEKETAQAISKMRDEQNAKLTEGAQIIKDSFLNAFDDMVHGGKLKVDELLKYILAEFSKRALSNLLTQALGDFGKSSSNSGGIWSAFASAFAADYGGARAMGGPVSAGKSYLVGERGAEIFRPSVPGAIVPNGGGGVSVQSVINIDARGATTESAKLLPAYAKQISEATEARIVERLRRKHYGRI